MPPGQGPKRPSLAARVSPWCSNHVDGEVGSSDKGHLAYVVRVRGDNGVMASYSAFDHGHVNDVVVPGAPCRARRRLERWPQRGPLRDSPSRTWTALAVAHHASPRPTPRLAQSREGPAPGQRDGGTIQAGRPARRRPEHQCRRSGPPRSRAAGRAGFGAAKQLVEQHLARCSFLRREGTGLRFPVADAA